MQERILELCCVLEHALHSARWDYSHHHPAITMNIESFFIKTVGEGTVPQDVNLTPLEEEYCYKSPFPQGISADDWIPDVSELDPFKDDEPSTNSKDDHPIPEHIF